MKSFYLISAALSLLALTHNVCAEIRVPAFTAYLEPEPNALNVSEESGITGWQDPAVRVCWFGQFTKTGALNCAVTLRLPAKAQSKLRLTVADRSVERVIKGNGEATRLDFGEFPISRPGYHRFL